MAKEQQYPTLTKQKKPQNTTKSWDWHKDFLPFLIIF